MANLLDLRNSVRSLCLLTTDDLSNVDLNTYINEGLLRLSSLFEWPWLKTSGTLTITGGNPEVSLPATFSHARAVLLDGTTTRLREISDIDAWERHGDDPPTGTPETFYIYDDSIFVQPVPSANTDIKLYYSQIPSVLPLDASVPPWDSQFHYVLVDFALARVWEREEDHARSREHMSQFDRTVNEMARLYMNRVDDNPIVFGERPDYSQRRRTNDNLPWLNGL